jgi:hypothetical protein
MNRGHALATWVALAALAAGCGHSGSSGSGPSPTTPQGVIRAGSAAVAKQDAVGFKVRIGIHMQGTLPAGPGAQLVPQSVALEGSTATSGTGKADIHFVFNVTGGSFSGELLTPDGRTGYVTLPSLLGAGWHSFPLRANGRAGGASAGAGLLGGLRPTRWLTDMKLTTSGSTDTVSASLAVPRMLRDLATLGSGTVRPAQLAQARAAFREASGSVSYDRSTRLPSAFAAHLRVIVPRSAGVTGLRGLDLTVDSTFSDWGKDFTVERPANATPIAGLRRLGGVFGNAG